MISDVYLYFNTNILTNRNFEIDDIASYLSSKTKTLISRFQYIKHSLFTTIKVDMSQSYLDYKQVDNIDYISIQNYNENESPEALVYYFVLNKRWLSKSTIAFDLYQDTINSFKGKYTLSDKTLVRREHKDRWEESMPAITEETFIDDSELIDDFYVYHLDYIPSTSPINSFTIDSESVDLDSYEVSIQDVDGVIHLVGNIYVSTETGDGGSIQINIHIQSGELRRKIDYYSEGLNPMLYKKNEDIINFDNLKWYLAYQNSSQPSSENPSVPVNCFLYPSQPISIRINGNTGIDSSYFTGPLANNFIEFQYDFNDQPCKVIIPEVDNLTLDVDKVNIILADNGTRYSNYRIQVNADDNTKIDLIHHVYDSYYDSSLNEWKAKNHKFTKLGTYSTLQINYSGEICYIFKAVVSVPPAQYGSILIRNYSLVLTYTPYELSSIALTDRTLSTYLKIIELPYCPIPYTLEASGVYSFGSYGVVEAFNEGVAGYRLKLNINFISGNENIITTNIKSPLSPIVDECNVEEGINRNDYYESKLYSSEFYSPKFIYDSFNYEFKLEAQNSRYLENLNKFRFLFKATTTINSRFLFAFIDEDLKMSISDYDSVLNIARSNEITLFNSSYLDYIRTGFNYDVKNKNLSNIATLTGAGLNLISSVGTIGMGVSTGNALAVAGGITSIGSSIIGAISSVIRNEYSLQEKLDQKRVQAVSVQGADDIDLLNYYANNNKAKIGYYSISDRVKALIADLFYYCGYSTQEYKIPNLDTRLYFNYIQADVIFESSSNLSEDILEDIKRRYAVGLTRIHKVNNQWDMNQKKENWEVSILND